MHIWTLGGSPLGFVSTFGAGVVEFADRCGVIWEVVGVSWLICDCKQQRELRLCCRGFRVIILECSRSDFWQGMSAT